MNICIQEAVKKMENMKKEQHFMTMSLSPQGFLVISKSDVLDISNFRLFFSGKWYRRNGFSARGSLQIRDEGQFLCAVAQGKMLVEILDGSMEFATTKKPLSIPFCFGLTFLWEGRVMMVLADSELAPEPFFITLTGTESNVRFVERTMAYFVGRHDKDAATKLFEEDEDDD